MEPYSQPLVPNTEDSNKIAAYCLLASLNEIGGDLFSSVYLPICKKAVSTYSEHSSKGLDSDIKRVIFDIFGITMPLYTINSLLRTIYKQMSRREKELNKFIVFENGRSFEIGEFAFNQLEDIFSTENRSVNSINTQFEEFKIKTDAKTEKTLYDYFNNNRKELSYFFSKAKTNSLNTSHGDYVIHAQFIEFNESNNPHTYDTLKKMYFGSTVASYIESGVDLNEKYSQKITYYLDTELVLKALDFQLEEDTQPARELISLIHNSGSIVKILDTTSEEIKGLLEGAARRLHKFVFIETIKNASIEHACVRRKISKTDLQYISSQLEDILSREFKITTDIVANEFRDKCAKLPETQELQENRNKESALHDVIAYQYVRMMRHGMQVSLSKANYWFVTPNFNLLKFNKLKLGDNIIPEISTPETLTSMLWLQNPSVLGRKSIDTGFHQLISETLACAVPLPELLYRLESNLKNTDNLDQGKYAMVINKVANYSSEQIQNLVSLSDNAPSDFSTEINQIVEQEKIRSNESRQTIERQQKEIEGSTIEVKNISTVASDLEFKLTLAQHNAAQLVAENTKTSDLATNLSTLNTELITRTQKLESEKRITEERALAETQRANLALEKAADLEAKLLQGNRERQLYKRIAIATLLIVSITAILFFTPKVLISKYFDIAYKFVLSAGGLWGLINLIINIRKLIKEENSKTK